MKLSRLTFSVLLIVLILWGTGFVGFTLHAAAQTPERMSEKTDAIIVLTGGNKRILTGLELYAKGLAPDLFITGVHKDVLQKEIIAQWNKTSVPLPPCCVILGHKATTTTENAIEAKEWIRKSKKHKIRLVTSSYHMTRALMEFHRAIPDIEILTYPVAETDHSLSDVKFWTLSFSEYNKVLFRSITMLIQDL
ncbi:MAG: YdcF family protein [Alphaproteobacteria bacterium]|nr:YdcF family protein [Alphaproteobacteria bacterium]